MPLSVAHVVNQDKLLTKALPDDIVEQ